METKSAFCYARWRKDTETFEFEHRAKLLPQFSPQLGHRGTAHQLRASRSGQFILTKKYCVSCSIWPTSLTIVLYSV